MTRIISRPAMLVLAVIASLLLAGCGSGPSKVDSAAIIGNRSVSLDSVQQEVRWLLDNVPQVEQARQQQKLALQSRQIVRSRVLHQLVTIAAAREGLRVDQAEVDRLVESGGGVDRVARDMGIAPERVRQLAADQVLLQQLAQRYLDGLAVRFVGTTIVGESAGNTAREQARALGERIAADPANAERVISESGHQLIQEELSFADALRGQPELGISALFGTREGSVMVIQPSQAQSGWLVALVRERTVTGSGQGNADLAAQLDPQVLYLAGVRMLQPIADELGVQLNPRYGVWDSAAMAPAANSDEVTGYLLPSRTVRP
ncbi:outer membrane murein-binding lipoprotein Lpp [Saccharomonospora amisosensis]|uniref:Outer membrane murein-binding lipoprotein Lpp n=1 Tax=Saccharomonospora amisosensis TaxID=1128677 RepID=A0A7X5UM73_9PSEU|nr:SurA N-terminal domain-containing protein [Saccharomonospora amisosensis]NIJ10596.1 outer membrane murein-binding lipoprotein Lpp [Saccharomonospora amisosensis]